MDGQQLKEKLKELGITQVKVAEILGVTPQTINAMMKNASISTNTLERLAKDEKIKELEATIQRLIGIIEKMQ